MNRGPGPGVFFCNFLPELKVFVYLPDFCRKRRTEKNNKIKRNEKNVPAIQQEEEKQARFQRENVECQWQEDPCPKESKRPKQTNRFF